VTRSKCGLLALSIISAGMLTPANGFADSWLDCFHKHGCPPSSYPCCLYWTPELYRIHWHRHCPKVPLYASDLHPEIPIGYRITPFPCPPVDPRDIPYGVGSGSRTSGPERMNAEGNQ
jgi:hypothetical protein